MSARLLVRDEAVVVERPTEQLAEHRDKPCWIDIPDRTSGELARVAKDLNLHPLAVEDATQRDERPKIDQYENHYFIVFYAIESPSPGVVRYHEFSIFVVPNAIVTVHDGDCEGRKQVEKRFREGRLHTTGPLLHALLDTMVDGYFAMNFQALPFDNIDVFLGGMALMIASAVLVTFYFKRRGWL